MKGIKKCKYCNKELNNIGDSYCPHCNKKQDISMVQAIIVIIIIVIIPVSFAIYSSSNKKEQFDYTIDSQGKNDLGVYTITGTVKNNSRKDIDGLQIEFKCYDDNNNSVAVVKAYTEHVLSGETWKYEAKNALDADRIHNCNFYKITPYIKIAEFK